MAKTKTKTTKTAAPAPAPAPADAGALAPDLADAGLPPPIPPAPPRTAKEAAERRGRAPAPRRAPAPPQGARLLHTDRKAGGSLTPFWRSERGDVLQGVIEGEHASMPGVYVVVLTRPAKTITKGADGAYETSTTPTGRKVLVRARGALADALAQVDSGDEVWIHCYRVKQGERAVFRDCEIYVLDGGDEHDDGDEGDEHDDGDDGDEGDDEHDGDDGDDGDDLPF